MMQEVGASDITDTSYWSGYSPQQYASRMLSARFCMVPAGDSATSRRLFDAMAAGCTPVYLGEVDDGSWASIAYTDPASRQSNLPLRSAVDWASHVIFAGALSCLDRNWQQGAKQLARWLESVANNRSQQAGATFEQVCRRQLQAYR